MILRGGAIAMATCEVLVELVPWALSLAAVFASLRANLIAAQSKAEMGRQTAEMRRTYQASAFILVSDMMKANAGTLADVSTTGLACPDRLYREPAAGMGLEPNNRKWNAELRGLLIDLEAVAFLADEEVVPRTWVQDMWCRALAGLWRVCEPRIEQWRAEQDDPSLYRRAQSLCEGCERQRRPGDAVSPMD